MKLDVVHLSIDKERYAAWNLNPGMPIGIRLDFHVAYTEAMTAPAVRALQFSAAESNLNQKEVDGQVEFGLGWLICHHLQEFFAANWPPKHDSADGASRGGDSAALADITDTCCCSLPIARAALSHAKGHATTAIDMMFDENQRVNIEKLAAAEAEKGGGQSQTHNQALLVEAVASRNVLVKIGLLIRDSIRHCTENCLLCGKAISNPGVKPSVCTEPRCVFAFESMGLGMELSVELTKNTGLMDLLIRFLYAGKGYV
jgi:hypothetical protein